MEFRMLQKNRNKAKAIHSWINNTYVGGFTFGILVFIVIMAPRYYDGYLFSKNYSLVLGNARNQESKSKGYYLAYDFKCPLNGQQCFGKRDGSYSSNNFNKEYWVAYSNCNPIMNAIFFDVPTDISVDSALQLITPKKVRKSYAHNVVKVLFDRDKYCP